MAGDDEKELIADQLRRGVSASEVMAGVRARAAAASGSDVDLEDAAEALVGVARRSLARKGPEEEIVTVTTKVGDGEPVHARATIRRERRVDLAGAPIEPATRDELEAVAATKPVVHIGRARRVRIENLDAAGHPMTTEQAITSLAAVPAPEIEVREVPYEVVAEWKSQAARDHVALGPTGNTTWYAAFRGKVIVGVAGLIRVGKVVRVKGVYVPRALRGEGIGTVLTEAVIAAAPPECDVEVLAYNPAFYQGRGFDTQGEFRKGVTRLIFARSR